mmetsp:Transcript_17417/g.44267  ORF Transcript_17417/g.44267 Transcript_17417/m.44267 type:complete len:103 (-) Transcript_17417:185-493(-)
MSPRTWDACDDPNPPTDCHGWCTLVTDQFVVADLDRSNSLSANEIGLLARALGLKEEGSDWATCIATVTSCMVDGYLQRPVVYLLGAAVISLPPSTCEDCAG